MPAPNRSLRCLESFAQLGATLSDWRRSSGDEFGTLEPLLVPTDRLATRWRVPGRSLMRVVEHAPDRAVAICDEDTHDEIPLSRSDRVMHRVHEGRLCSRLCQSLGLHASNEQPSRLPGTLVIGTWTPRPTTSITVSLVVASSPDHLAELVIGAGAAASCPALLVTPTRTLWTSRSDAVIPRTNVSLASLDGLLELKAGEWARSPAFDEFAPLYLPSPASPSLTSSALANTVSEQVKLLNEMQRNVVQALSERGFVEPKAKKLPGQALLAKWAGYEFDTTFKNAMSSLVKTRLVDNAKHHGRRGGYFLTAIGTQAAEIIIRS